MGVIVETTNGRVAGSFNRGVHVFRGIQYAASTAAKNRFLPPQPVEKWSGTRDAVISSGSAPQNPNHENTDPFYAWYSEIQPISEDCLRLNAFTPGTDAGRRPVMVWLHGGGWSEFSGTAPGFDGSNLARAEDVVVVSLNHRLGVFGFLQLGMRDERFADAGNIGAMDIVAALEWVRENIAAFGGDPGNVTLFGESGGGSKIAALLAMKAARNLFHKAVIQSSGSGLRLVDAEYAARAAQALAKELGLAELDPVALQDAPIPAILGAAKRTGAAFRASIDGRNFDSHPFAGKAPEISAKIPLLVGCTRTEGTYYLRGDSRNFSLLLSDVRRRLARFLQTDEAAVARLVDIYRSERPQETASGLFFLIISDFTFKRTTYQMANLKARMGNAPVFAYHFEWQTPIEMGRMGSPHTVEVPFIFGTAQAARGCVGNGPDLQYMTTLMMASWAAFARSGNPESHALVGWETFDEATKRMMVLDKCSRTETNPAGTSRFALEGFPPYDHAYPVRGRSI